MARLFVVLALDVVLIGAGIAMILTYLDSRSSVDSEQTSATEHTAPVGEVEVLLPTPVSPEELAREKAEAKAVASVSARRPSGGAKQRPSNQAGSATATGPSGANPTVTPPSPDGGSASGTGDNPALPVDLPDPKTTFATPPPDAGAEASEKDVQTMARKIAVVVSRHQSQLKRCYERAAKATNPNDPLQGRIDIRFSVMPDGSAANVRAARNSSGSTTLETCVVGLVKSWDFPAGASEPLDFMWPFIFKVPK